MLKIPNNHYLDHNGVLHQKDIDPDYQKQYQSSYLDHYKNFGNEINILRLAYIEGAIGLVNTLLDIGYGTGNFLKHCNENNIICSGYDIIKDSKIMEDLRSDDIQVFEDFNDIFNTKYDVITLYDTLEHIKDINFIRNLKCNYLVISIPHRPYLIKENNIENWHHFKPNEHLHYFNLASMESFLDENGYKIIHAGPVEDAIRKGPYPNILTVIAKKDNVNF